MRVLSPDGVFINDLYEPSAHVLEGLIETHLDTKLALGGFDPNAKPALGGSNPDAPMMTPPANVAVVPLDQAD